MFNDLTLHTTIDVVFGGDAGLSDGDEDAAARRGRPSVEEFAKAFSEAQVRSITFA
jgi:hypothetical protein